jgi:hypothetical protein
MRAIDYVTNGFGGPREDLARLAQTQEFQAAAAAANANRAPILTDLGYLSSPSGGLIGGAGRGIVSLQDRFGDLVARLVPYGLNPRFLDIVRGPGGRGFLVQTIRLVNAYRANLRRYKYNINAAYNNSVAIAGGESFLMPRSFLTNPDLIPKIDEGGLSLWLTTVLSAL